MNELSHCLLTYDTVCYDMIYTTDTHYRYSVIIELSSWRHQTKTDSNQLNPVPS